MRINSQITASWALAMMVLPLIGGCGAPAVPSIPEELREVCACMPDWNTNNLLSNAVECRAEGYSEAEMLAVTATACEQGAEMFGEVQMTRSECEACGEAVVKYVYR